MTEDPVTDATGRARPMWLNPPRHDDPQERVVVELTQEAAAEIVGVLRSHAEALDPARITAYHTLRTVADDIDAARMTPAEADQRLSREASWHPINQLQRLLPTVLRTACRWLAPTAVVTQAIETAAAIAYSRDGAHGKEELLAHVLHTMHRTAETAYPTRRAKS